MLWWSFRAICAWLLWGLIVSPEQVNACIILCKSTNIHRNLAASSWNDLETFCSNIQYELALTFHQEHTLLKATPLEQNPFCTTVYFHKENGIKQSYYVQNIHDNEDEEGTLDNNEQNFQEDNEIESSLLLGIFEFQEIVAAYESTPITDRGPSTNGYDLVMNNCASVTVHMMSNLGILSNEEQRRAIIQHSTTNLRKSKSILQSLQANPSLKHIIPTNNTQEISEETIQFISDQDLVELLVSSYIDRVEAEISDEEDGSICFAVQDNRHLQSNNYPDDTENCNIRIFVNEGTNGVGFLLAFQCGPKTFGFYPCFKQINGDISTHSFGQLEDFTNKYEDLGSPSNSIMVGTSRFGDILKYVEASSGEITGQYELVRHNCYARIVEVLKKLGHDPSKNTSIRDQIVKRAVSASLAEYIRADPVNLAILFNGKKMVFDDNRLVAALYDYTVDAQHQCGDGIRQGSESCDLGEAQNGQPGSTCTSFCAKNNPWYCLSDNLSMGMFYTAGESRYECKYRPSVFGLTQDPNNCGGNSCARYWCNVFGWGRFEAPDTCHITPCPWADGYILIDQNTCIAGGSFDITSEAKEECIRGGGTFDYTAINLVCKKYAPCPHSFLLQHDVEGKFLSVYPDSYVSGQHDMCYGFDRPACDGECLKNACELSGGVIGTSTDPFTCMYTPSTTLICSSHVTKDRCEGDEDNECYWSGVGSMARCLPPHHACEAAIDAVDLEITPKGGSPWDPYPLGIDSYFDIRFKGIASLEPFLSISTVSVHMDGTLKVWEVLPGNQGDDVIVRVYSMETEYGKTVDVKLFLQNCHLPIITTMKIANTAPTDVIWYNKDGSAQPHFPSPIGITWNDARDFCTSQGKRLCRKDEVCIGDAAAPLVAGAMFTNEDEWIAVSNDGLGGSCEDNNWVQIGRWAGQGGMRPSKCETHQGVTGVCPSWGKTGGLTYFQEYAACCP